MNMLRFLKTIIINFYLETVLIILVGCVTLGTDKQLPRSFYLGLTDWGWLIP